MRISDWSSDVCSSDLGHGGCGGVKASLSEAFKDAKPGEGGFIAHWIDLLDEERDRVRAAAALHPDLDAQRALAQAPVRVSIRNPRTFPSIPERHAAGRLTLPGPYSPLSDAPLPPLPPPPATLPI